METNKILKSGWPVTWNCHEMYQLLKKKVRKFHENVYVIVPQFKLRHNNSTEWSGNSAALGKMSGNFTKMEKITDFWSCGMNIAGTSFNTFQF